MLLGRLREAFWQGLGLFFLGISLGVLNHELRGSSLPWIGSWSPEMVAARHLEGLQEITLAQALEEYQAGRALFLDARDPGSFATGHLPGALNVPPSEAASMAQEIRTLAEAGMVPVAYCDGMDCPLSGELARALKELGVGDVRVLVNGWSRWREAGYPTEESSP